MTEAPEWIPTSELTKAMDGPPYKVEFALKGIPRDTERALTKHMSIGGGSGESWVPREAVQNLLDAGTLKLREEPTTPAMIRLYASPTKFLLKYGLKHP